MNILQDLEELIAEIEKKKSLEPWLDTIWLIEYKWAAYRLQMLLGPYLVRGEGFLTFAHGGVSIKTEENNPPEEISEPGIYFELCDGTFLQIDPVILFGTSGEARSI